VIARLKKLKKKTGWSWERLCREFHRVQGSEGPSHTTLYRYARGKVRRHNKVVARWIEEAIGKVENEQQKG